VDVHTLPPPDTHTHTHIHTHRERDTERERERERERSQQKQKQAHIDKSSTYHQRGRTTSRRNVAICMLWAPLRNDGTCICV